MRESVSIQDTLDFLNELIAIDPEAIRALVETRVPCNEKLSEHPTVQVKDAAPSSTVGFLGILNGLFGVDDHGWGPIGIIFEEDGCVTGAKRISWEE